MACNFSVTALKTTVMDCNGDKYSSRLRPQLESISESYHTFSVLKYDIHLPKKASLISVLSVRRIIFTTKMTASGVRNEIACKR